MKHFFAFTVALILAVSISLEAAEFYVSPTGRADALGTEQVPFNSLESARDTLRRARQAGTLTPEESVTIHVAPGNYFLSRSFELGREDSGTKNAPVIYRATKPFEAKLIGGIILPASAWKPIEDPEILKRLDTSVHGKVFVADLSVPKIPSCSLPQKLLTFP